MKQGDLVGNWNRPGACCIVVANDTTSTGIPPTI